MNFMTCPRSVSFLFLCYSEHCCWPGMIWPKSARNLDCYRCCAPSLLENGGKLSTALLDVKIALKFFRRFADAKCFYICERVQFVHRIVSLDSGAYFVKNLLTCHNQRWYILQDNILNKFFFPMFTFKRMKFSAKNNYIVFF